MLNRFKTLFTGAFAIFMIVIATLIPIGGPALAGGGQGQAKAQIECQKNGFTVVAQLTVTGATVYSEPSLLTQLRDKVGGIIEFSYCVSATPDNGSDEFISFVKGDSGRHGYMLLSDANNALEKLLAGGANAAIADAVGGIDPNAGGADANAKVLKVHDDDDQHWITEGKAQIVKYGMLGSFWLPNGTRDPQLILCLAPQGCVFSHRGDTRWYDWSDGTLITADEFPAAIEGELASFPHAQTLVDNNGNVLWTKTGGLAVKVNGGG